MTQWTEAQIEELIEQATHHVLLAMQAAESSGSYNDHTTMAMTAQEYLEKVQPVVSAGADRIASTLNVAPTDGSLSHMIDHTLLKPDASHDQVARLCYEAKKYDFISVCVNPSYVKLCSDLLKGSSTLVCTVVGFPLGATSTDAKVFETQQAIREGAKEIDMVINIGALKSRDYQLLRDDIAAIANATHAGGAILKVIIEAAMLTDEEKVIACQLAKLANADFVKTSTGFGPGGATPEDVALMRRVVGSKMGVKAAGGIRSYEDAKKMIAAGASRIGASASVKILQGAPSTSH